MREEVLRWLRDDLPCVSIDIEAILDASPAFVSVNEPVELFNGINNHPVAHSSHYH